MDQYLLKNKSANKERGNGPHDMHIITQPPLISVSGFCLLLNK